MTGVRPFFAGSAHVIETIDRSTGRQAQLDEAANALFGLFLEREKDFAFGPGMVVDHPDVTLRGAGSFSDDPAGYIDRRLKDLAVGEGGFGTVTVLTTYGDRVGAALCRAGYDMTGIDMPAGPDHTAAFHRTGFSPRSDAGLLHVEAVNEADSKIRPAFALLLRDGEGVLRGGACGSLAQRDGRTYCYLATLTVAEGMPAGTGQRLGGHLIDHLRGCGVHRIDVGTQTAAPFYEKIGFEMVHRIVPGLRRRPAAAGGWIDHDLAMLSLVLDMPTLQ